MVVLLPFFWTANGAQAGYSGEWLWTKTACSWKNNQAIKLTTWSFDSFRPSADWEIPYLLAHLSFWPLAQINYPVIFYFSACPPVSSLSLLHNSHPQFNTPHNSPARQRAQSLPCILEALVFWHSIHPSNLQFMYMYMYEATWTNSMKQTFPYHTSPQLLASTRASVSSSQGKRKLRVDGDLAESIKCSASDRLGDLVP